MTKQEFLDGLKKDLAGLPSGDLDERLDFYAEMIDDRMEEGMPEEDAVAAIGSVKSVAEQILKDIPLTKIAKEKIKKGRKLKTWEIVLLAVGSPVWFTLLVVLVAVVIALYASLWSVIIAFWACFAAFCGSAAGGIAAGVILIVSGRAFVGIAYIGAALVIAGIAIFSFFGCTAATNGIVWLTKKMILGIKKCFVGKGDAE